MAVYRRTSRTRYLLAVLVLASLTLVTLNARSNGRGVTGDMRAWANDAFSPLERGTHTALQPIGNFLTGAIDYGSLRSQNQKLRQEVASLQNQSVRAAADDQAAAQVLGLQHLPFVGAIPTVTAEIVDNGSSNFEDTVTIDKGTSSGIIEGQPVVSSGGLVGSVQNASSRTATIVLLTDPTFAVGLRLGGGNFGSAQGEGLLQPLRVTVDTPNVVPKPRLRVGQALWTSGLDLEKYPPNLPVGRVHSVSQPPGASEPTITISPIVNLNQLTYVDVMLWSPEQ